MSLLVRSWNVFHGNTLPVGGESRLEEMIARATADEPDVLCLQEVPVWAVERLGEWSGMAVYAEVARPPSIGPLPATRELARQATGVLRGRARTLFAGHANATLVRKGHVVTGRHALVLNERRFRRVQADWLGLPLVARLAWAKERRVAVGVRLEPAEGRPVFVANLHATAYPADQRLADAELLRAATWADALARPDDVCVLAGDFNISAPRSWTIREVTSGDWGFRGPGPGIDHVLVRGSRAAATIRWRDERRRCGDRLLSDHAPVERRLG